MAASPFTPRELPRLTLLQRVLRRRAPEHALIELRNALAAAASPRDVTAVQVAEIGQRHGVDLTRHFRPDREALYGDFLLYCLHDRHLSEEELADARHLASLFVLPDEVCATILRRVARLVYLRSLAEVLEDGVIDAEEQAFLRQLRASLGIPPETARNMEEMRLRQLMSRRS